MVHLLYPVRAFSEKVVFQDKTTGSEIWNMTNNPELPQSHHYYDIQPWSPDGSKITFMSSGTLAIMSADGSKMKLTSVKRCYYVTWDSSGMYIYYYDPNRKNIARYSLADDASEILTTTPSWVRAMDVSCDGKKVAYVMQTEPYELRVVDTERMEEKIIVAADGIDQARFSPTDPDLLFYEKAERAWLINADGTNNRVLYDQTKGTHWDWKSDGNGVSFVAKVKSRGLDYPLRLVTLDGRTKDIANGYGWMAHQSWSPVGDYIIADPWRQYANGGYLEMVDAQSGEVTLLAYAHSSWDKQHTHPHPHPSVDGTKVLFASDLEDLYGGKRDADVLVLVVRMPEPPSSVTVTPGDRQIGLRWKQPVPGKEIKDYNIYRSTSREGKYTKVNASLVLSTEYVDNGLTNGLEYFYAVTAVEHSGLESEHSEKMTGTPKEALPPLAMEVITEKDVPEDGFSWASRPRPRGAVVEEGNRRSAARTTQGGQTKRSSLSSVIQASNSLMRVEAQLSGDQVQLTWQSPAGEGFSGVMIRYSTDGTYPQDPKDGTFAAIKPGKAGEKASFTHTGLSLRTTYRYALFPYDQRSLFFPPDTISVRIDR